MTKKGDKVKIKIPPREQKIAGGGYKYDGEIHTVTRAKSLKKRDGSYADIYELEGCVSRAGVHYTYCAEWLERVEEGEK